MMVSVDITTLTLKKELHSCAKHRSAPSWYLDNQRLVIMPVANPTSLTSLYVRRSFPKLKAMSQQYLNNTINNVQLDMQNDCGIFGACPGEIHRLILIGWFRNMVDSFFI